MRCAQSVAAPTRTVTSANATGRRTPELTFVSPVRQFYSRSTFGSRLMPVRWRGEGHRGRRGRGESATEAQRHREMIGGLCGSMSLSHWLCALATVGAVAVSAAGQNAGRVDQLPDGADLAALLARIG